MVPTHGSWSESDPGPSACHFCFRVKAEVIQRHKALREDVNLGPRKVAVVAGASTRSYPTYPAGGSNRCRVSCRPLRTGTSMAAI